MLKIKTNACNTKGNLRPNVRDAIKEAVTSVTINFANGTTATLTPQGHGDYYGELALCDDICVRGNAHLAITIKDYHYNAPARKSEPDTETITLEVAD